MSLISGLALAAMCCNIMIGSTNGFILHALGYIVTAPKLYKIRNVSFGDIFIFLYSLMLRHHLISKKQKSHPK